MNILSAFDGLSGAQIASERAGLPVENYFSCEIDKYAVKVTQANYPATIQLGNIIDVKSSDLPKIDLLIGGSPCQGFSFAGKGLNFKDHRSALFFEYIRLLRECEPTYFLLENVRMKKEYRDEISRIVGVEPIMINSSLVSAQNRNRLYWTNIPGVKQPEDEGVFLRDVIFSDGFPVIYQGPRDFNNGGLKFNKSPSVTSSSFEHNNMIFQRGHGRTTGGVTVKRKSPCVSCSFANNVYKYIHTEKAISYMNRAVGGGRSHWDFKHHSDVRNDKSSTVVANFFKGVPYNVLKDWGCIRKFHPVEVERLQTIPDDYTNHVSDTQRYKMIGNGFTIDVVAHILSHVTGSFQATETL